MSRGAYYDVFMDHAGNILAGASVVFTGAAGGTVYSAASGGTAYAGGTVVAGSDGSLNVYPDADRYTVAASLAGFSSATKTVDVSVPPDSVGSVALADIVAPTFHDDAYTRAAGALGNARSGQAWSALGANPPAYIKGGGEWVARITYGTTPAGADEFFATTVASLGGPLLAGGGKFKIRASSPSTFAGNLIVGSWDGTTDVVPVHIALTQYFYTLGYVAAGVQAAVDPDQRGASPIPYINTPLKADGATVYEVWWALDQGAGVLYAGMPDGTVVSATDAHFAAAFAAAAERPIFEGQVSASTDAIFEWLDVWASTSVPHNIALRIGSAP